MKKKLVYLFLLLWLCCNQVQIARAQFAMTNVYGRKYVLLNGKWDVIIDPYLHGHKDSIYKDKPLKSKSDFKEYAFEGGVRLNVPGDWNSQYPELKYYEGTVWYARHFSIKRSSDENVFLYFGAVNYQCTVYLNGTKVGGHEGGFTPFQINITDRIVSGDNFLVLEVNNYRNKDAIPALLYDWWNYGGITRDVMIVKTPQLYIDHYFIQLDKYKLDLVHVKVQLSEKRINENIRITIPALNVLRQLSTDSTGMAQASIKVKRLQRWSPQTPQLYLVQLATRSDTIKEELGFRNLYVKGKQIYLNGSPVFMKGISFHEEIAQRQGRAFSQQDAVALLSEAKALGANLIRLAHYPQNEYIVRLAEKMGFMLWEEIPLWQNIDFTSKVTLQKALTMHSEMIMRDRNRCALTFWGIANETSPSKSRNSFLKEIINNYQKTDTTRLLTAAFDKVKWNGDTQTFELEDTLTEYLDVISINKYMGWYHPWPIKPSEISWNICPDKPLFISEFGGEALYGQSGDATVASSWSEEYQEQLYKDNLEMFISIPNLTGIAPWILFDFRSPYRFHPLNQNGWNRKGLISDQGYRKKAWYVINEFYKKH